MGISRSPVPNRKKLQLHERRLNYLGSDAGRESDLFAYPWRQACITQRLSHLLLVRRGFLCHVGQA